MRNEKEWMERKERENDKTRSEGERKPWRKKRKGKTNGGLRERRMSRKQGQEGMGIRMIEGRRDGRQRDEKMRM